MSKDENSFYLFLTFVVPIRNLSWYSRLKGKDNAITKKRRIGTSLSLLGNYVIIYYFLINTVVSIIVARHDYRDYYDQNVEVGKKQRSNTRSISIFFIQMARLGMIDWWFLHSIRLSTHSVALNTRDNHTILIHDVLVRRDYCTTTKKIQVVTLYENHPFPCLPDFCSLSSISITQSCHIMT